ncbi:membrane-associating domain-containing protein [Microdochium nivale]|nr:membrane-associating domain-containing protein [Microdochium nivale]
MFKSAIKTFGKGVASKPFFIYETMARWLARGLQFVFALIVCGLYGHRVAADNLNGQSQDPAWVFALIVAGMSCITCVVYAIPNPFVKTHRLFPWDLLLLLLWIVVFGIFASTFLTLAEDVEEYKGASVTVMRGAVWVDLVNCIFWMITGSYGCFRSFLGDKINNKIDNKLDDLESAINHKVDGYVPGGLAKAEEAHGKYGHLVPKVLPKILDKVYLKR